MIYWFVLELSTMKIQLKIPDLVLYDVKAIYYIQTILHYICKILLICNRYYNMNLIPENL